MLAAVVIFLILRSERMVYLVAHEEPLLSNDLDHWTLS